MDDNLIKTMEPGEEGFWGFGEFENQAPGTENPWKYSKSKMAPFDKEVFISTFFLH